MEDDVDRIVADWARERPDLDVGPMHILSRVTRLSRLLDRARQEAFGDGGIVGWEFDVLAALRRAGSPYQLSPKHLLAETLVTSGTMTTRVDRLVERGLVVRRPDPADGRSVLVRLTEEGRKTVDRTLAMLLQREADMVSSLSTEDQGRLAGDLRQLLLGFGPGRLGH